MSVYSSKLHRKVYEQHFGPIPKEADGRSYEIHHIDGNPENNNIANLQAVTLQEHYDIHYSQGDYGACFKMAEKLSLTPQEISDISRKTQLKRLAAGTHNWQNSETQAAAGRRSAIKLFANRTHNFIKNKDKIADLQRQRVKDGSHNLLGPATNLKRINEGTHNFVGSNSPSQVIWECPCCHKVGKGKGNYTKYHGDSCKFKKERI